jgi:septum site-determining protein MinC
MSSVLAIKGIREGLLITLGGSTWAEALEEMLAHIDSKGDFFLGARIAVRLGEHLPRAADLADLRGRLAKRGLTLWAVLTDAPAVVAAAQSLALATALPSPPAGSDAPLESAMTGTAAVLVESTLHSGKRIEYAGHVVVLGDVSPGVEIVAGGHVIVWGKLRGTVHAGAHGNEHARVCALDLSPMQLRIAGHAATSPSRRGSPQPEVVRLRNGNLVTDVWKPGGRELK